MSKGNDVSFRNENRDFAMPVNAGESRQINNHTSRSMEITITSDAGSEVRFTAIAGSGFTVSAQGETLHVLTDSGSEPPTIEGV